MAVTAPTEAYLNCLRCKQSKPLSDYHRNKDWKTHGRYPYCKPCRKIQWQERYAKNRDHIREGANWRALKHRTGVTREQFETMLEEQNGVCAICLDVDRSKNRGRLTVDHCHKTGVVRGLLCSNCNAMLGQIKDDTSNLHRAIEYLDRNGV